VGGWLGWIVRSARIQREAIAGIEANGGAVIYDLAFWLQISFDHGPYLRYGEISNHTVWPPRWLVKTIGIDYFANAKTVYVGDASDAALSHVEKLGKVQEVQMLRPTDEKRVLNDAGIVHLAKLKDLRKLDLFFTRITDAGLIHLAKLTNLSELHIIPELLSRTEFEQAMSNGSASFTLFHIRVTDAGIAHLSTLTNLTTLDLRGTHVSDAGLAHLSRLCKLSFLSLERTQVTDAGLVHLTSLPKLTTLNVSGTRVTRSGIQELNRAMPNLTVKR
jgi:hypothetical protein